MTHKWVELSSLHYQELMDEHFKYDALQNEHKKLQKQFQELADAYSGEQQCNEMLREQNTVLRHERDFESSLYRLVRGNYDKALDQRDRAIARELSYAERLREDAQMFLEDDAMYREARDTLEWCNSKLEERLTTVRENLLEGFFNALNNFEDEVVGVVDDEIGYEDDDNGGICKECEGAIPFPHECRESK